MKWCNLLLIFLCCCSSKQEMRSKRLKLDNLQVEEITRSGDKKALLVDYSKPLPPPRFPWDGAGSRRLPTITKEYLRCRGNPLNPKKKQFNEKGETEEIVDCGGYEEHGLPLLHGKERVPKVLIDLLNGLQEKLDRRVVITSGHRCPQHNRYVDPSKANQTSKHLLGAEVSFYVEDYEWRPQEILKTLFTLFPGTPFKEWTKPTDVSSKPWYNDELFIKLYTHDEGRDFDNRHPFPYLTVQVRYDKELDERVTYSWEKANRHYLRKS